MRLLAISGSLRAGSYNTALARAAADVAPDGCRGRGLRRARRAAALRRRPRRRRENAAVRHLRDEIGAADARALRHPGVQRLHSRRSQERRRLGIAATRRGRAPQQDGRGRGREHRPVRRDLGPAGPSPRARYRRCACRLPRSSRSPRARRLRRIRRSEPARAERLRAHVAELVREAAPIQSLLEHRNVRG